jgi:photosynthetic reaction center cytochrome c subunit
MNRLSCRRSTFVLIAAACGAFSIPALAQNPPAETMHGHEPKTAAQQFKNIQVLKDIPADQLIPAMQFITASLGVDCEYCHVEHAFDKDDKKTKLTARKMMEMMMAINRENFEGHREVTCYSCHRGASKPVGIPIITAEEKIPEMMAGEAVPASALPKPEELLDKYLAAVGGAEALKKITSRVEEGTLSGFGGRKLPIEIYAKAPDQRVSIMHMQQGESVTGYNGKEGWLSFPGRVHMMNAQESFEARIDADMTFPEDVRKMYQKFATQPGEEIDGHETWLVIGSNDGQPQLKLYFDQQTGLLIRMLRYVDSPLGYNPTQIDYADYREADGVKLPFRWTLARPGGRFTIQVEQLQQNVPLDEAHFTPPPPTPPPAH